jgi:hypothetical protein
MANPFSVNVPNALEALTAFESGYGGMQKLAKERQMAAGRRFAADALASGGDTRNALARLLEAGDVQGAQALAQFGNQAFDQNYKTQMLDLQRQAMQRREVPQQIQLLNAAGIDPRSPEGRKALFPRTDTPISATDKRAIFEAEDAVPGLQGTIENLDKALELNPQTFSGAGASYRAWAGSNLPDFMVPDAIADKKGANATTEWQKIMGPEALSQMASTLKGATTDFELRKFIEMLGDPATPPDIRKGVIQRMKRLAERKLELQKARMNDLRGGEYFKPGGGQAPAQAAPQAADPLAQARDAIARGASRDAVIQRLQQHGIDASGL